MKIYVEYYSTNILNCGCGLNTIIKETPKTYVCENDISKEQFIVKKENMDIITNVYDSLRFLTVAKDEKEGKEKSKKAYKEYFEKKNII